MYLQSPLLHRSMFEGCPRIVLLFVIVSTTITPVQGSQYSQVQSETCTDACTV